jgi:hypothetical protein
MKSSVEDGDLFRPGAEDAFHSFDRLQLKAVVSRGEFGLPGNGGADLTGQLRGLPIRLAAVNDPMADYIHAVRVLNQGLHHVAERLDQGIGRAVKLVPAPGRAVDSHFGCLATPFDMRLPLRLRRFYG